MKDKTNNFYKTAFYILIGLILIGGAAYFGYQYSQSKNQEQEVSKNTPTKQPTKKAEPTQAKLTITADEEPTDIPPEDTSTSIDAIRQAMAGKYGKDVSEVNLTVDQIETSYASGSVNFEGEMGGGWFLASEVGGTWIIVADGNGRIMCAAIEPYDFPVSMVPECWDETTNELIYR